MLVFCVVVAVALYALTLVREEYKPYEDDFASEAHLVVAPVPRPVMHEAAADGDVPRLSRLIDVGVDVNERDASDESPLHWAATGEVVSLLVEHGADLSLTGQAGQGPLSSACFRMRPTAVERLLELGCDVDERGAIFGSTPLICAVVSLVNQSDPLRTDSERIAIIRMLKAAGADIGAANNDGDTALGIARRYEAESIIRVLEE